MKYSRWSIVVIFICLLFICAMIIYFHHNSRDRNKIIALPTPIVENSIGEMKDRKHATPHNDQNFNPINSSQDTTRKVIEFTQKHLIHKYDIQVTDSEIHDYLHEEYNDLISEESFIELKENVDAQIAAAESVVLNNVDPKEAAEKYLKKWGGGTQIWVDMLKTMNKERLEEMRAMRPLSISDMYEKSIPGHREIVKRYKLAKTLLDDKNLDVKSISWLEKYNKILLDYAKNNLIGKVPELKDINPNELQYNENQYDLFKDVPNENETVPPQDRNKDNTYKNGKDVLKN